MSNELEGLTLCLIVIIGMLIAFAVMVNMVLKAIDFKQELRYINTEINRTVGGERKYRRRKRTGLRLSLISFVKYR